MSIFVFHLLNKNLKNQFFSKRSRYFSILYPPPKTPGGTLPYPIETSHVQNLVGFLAPWPNVPVFKIETLNFSKSSLFVIFRTFE